VKYEKNDDDGDLLMIEIRKLTKNFLRFFNWKFETRGNFVKEFFNLINSEKEKNRKKRRFINSIEERKMEKKKKNNKFQVIFFCLKTGSKRRSH